MFQGKHTKGAGACELGWDKGPTVEFNKIDFDEKDSSQHVFQGISLEVRENKQKPFPIGPGVGV